MGVLHGVNAYRSPTKTGCTRSGVHHITARVSDAVDAVLNRLMRFDVAKLQLAAVTRAIMQTVGLSVRMGAVTHRAGAGRALAVVCVVGPADRVGASGAGAAEVARGLPPARRAGWWVRQIGTAAFVPVPVCAPLLCFLPGRPLAGAPGYRRTPWAGVALAVTPAKGTTLLIRARCAQTLERRSSH